MRYTQKQAAELAGLTYSNLRYWEKSGKLIPYIANNGDKYYTDEQIEYIKEKLKEAKIQKQRNTLMRLADENRKHFKGYYEHTYKGVLYTVFQFNFMMIIYVGKVEGIKQLEYRGIIEPNTELLENLLENYANLPNIDYVYKTFKADEIYKVVSIANERLRNELNIKHEIIFNDSIQEQFTVIDDYWFCNTYHIRDLIDTMILDEFSIVIERNNSRSFGYICTDNCLGILAPIKM